MAPDQEKMFHDNLGLINSALKTLRVQVLTHGYEDCWQEASIALMQACEMFDPTLGNQFSTVAFKYIRSAIINMGKQCFYQKKGVKYRKNLEFHSVVPEVQGNTNPTLSAVLEDELHEILNTTFLDSIELWLASYPITKADIFRKRYLNQMSFVKISKGLNITPQRVQQICRAMLEDARNTFANSEMGELV